MTAPGVFGQLLGTGFFRLNFFFNWGYGQIFQNRYDHVGFKAYTKIYLPQDTFCRFRVFANNCFVLYIDGAKVLEHWGMGEALGALLEGWRAQFRTSLLRVGRRGMD